MSLSARARATAKAAAQRIGDPNQLLFEIIYKVYVLPRTYVPGRRT